MSIFWFVVTWLEGGRVRLNVAVCGKFQGVRGERRCRRNHHQVVREGNEDGRREVDGDDAVGTLPVWKAVSKTKTAAMVPCAFINRQGGGVLA